MPTARKQQDNSLTPAQTVPQFTLGDRLRRARRDAGMEAQELAEQLGVSRNTISNAENDRGPVARRTLVSWAFITRVPLEWLERGTGPDHTPNPGPNPGSTNSPPSPQTPVGAGKRRKAGKGPNSWWSSAPAAHTRVLPHALNRRPSGNPPKGPRCRQAA